MQYHRVGKSGPRVSRIALGGLTLGGRNADNATQWMLTEEDSKAVMRRCVELGINFIDTADAYSDGESESVIGRAWKEIDRRENFFIATKAGSETTQRRRESLLSRANLSAAVEASLRRLKTDYIDLYQLHQLDPATPWEETLEALAEVVSAGKVRYIGVSNILAFQLMKMLSLSEKSGWPKFSFVQNHYNLTYREEEREMLPLCRMEGVGFLAWSPLARGFLAGTVPQKGVPTSSRSSRDLRILQYYSEPWDFAVLDRVNTIAAQRQIKSAQVAIAWILSKPEIVAPIIGVTKLGHVEDAAAAVDIVLTDEEIKYLEAPYKAHPVYLHL